MRVTGREEHDEDHSEDEEREAHPGRVEIPLEPALPLRIEMTEQEQHHDEQPERRDEQVERGRREREVVRTGTRGDERHQDRFPPGSVEPLKRSHGGAGPRGRLTGIPGIPVETKG